MTDTVRLPLTDGGWQDWRLQPPRDWPRPPEAPTARRAYAAAHVVADPWCDNAPGQPARVDWTMTLAFRRHLWDYGFGVAEAMDTAQRGMGLDWEATQQLIRRSAAEAAACGGLIACGAGTDHLTENVTRLPDVTAGYEQQVSVVEESGATVILMASRQLAAIARGPDDYVDVYATLLRQVARPVILHWLGPMFDPALSGYWGTDDLDVATDVVLAIIRDHAAAVDGIKVSLLDADRERLIRAALPDGVRLYTGDDYNYADLIRGDGTGHSDALLGVLAAIAPAAATALQSLDEGDLAAYDEAILPTVPLARHLFAPPTRFYKTGIAFLAWLTGAQPGFTMVDGLQSGRSALHLVEAFRLADRAGLLPNPGLAAERMRAYLVSVGLRP